MIEPLMTANIHVFRDRDGYWRAHGQSRLWGVYSIGNSSAEAAAGGVADVLDALGTLPEPDPDMIVTKAEAARDGGIYRIGDG